MLNSRATVSIAALSGGNNLATALSLNACPYLATSFFHYRPLIQDSIEATTILTQGGAWGSWIWVAYSHQWLWLLLSLVPYLLLNSVGDYFENDK